jgi:outer membrane receptor protein involved in Fe transport
MNPLYAQEKRSSVIRGSIQNERNELLEYTTVYLKNTGLSAYSDNKGNFFLRVTPGEHILCVQYMGYVTYEKQIKIEPQEIKEVHIRLEEQKNELKEVVVQAKSTVQRVNESAFNVVAIDTKVLQNTSMDLAHILDRVSVIKLRETGGTGSENHISLNGFSGRHVKVFMDGMPIEGFGSSFRMSNIPVNLADRIEVYKGVVPVELGADALGGAINIVTKKTSNTYLDASYSYGSFNTHKSNISFGHTSPKGFVFQLNAFQNYSDNDYKIKTNLLDLTTNRFSKEEYRFKRFHDHYRSETLIAKAGVVNKPWASRLMVGVTLNHEKADIQNANLMKIVFGGRERQSRSYIPSLNYEKRNLFVENLHFALTANYTKDHNNNLDTLARQYNWRGEYRTKGSKGESNYSLSEYDNTSQYITANLHYRIGEKHYLGANNVYSAYSRKASDAAANAETATEASFMKRKNAKNVLGLSYRFEPTRKWNTSVFMKYYQVNVSGPIDTSSTTTAKYEEQKRSFGATGYGLAMTYLLTNDIQLKASFEKAFRLPTENELFGDEVLETGDVALKPENSQNINLNASYNKLFNDIHSVYFDLGLVYRDTRDYIRRQIEQRYGGAFYTNHGQVRNLGMDVEARYFYKKTLTFGGNFTYQNIRNRKKQSPTGQTLVYYNDRMPNVPYLFGNLNVSYSLYNFCGHGNVLSVGYNMQYVHQFYRNWQSEGGDIFIPKQLSHDANITYTMQNGRYNLSFEIKNLTDELLYDNYSLQKPGRSLSLKLRYFFFKSKN